MGRKSENASRTSPVDQYRKQLGRQEKKVDNERRREMKRHEKEQKSVSFWKKVFWSVGALLFVGIVVYSGFVFYFSPKEDL